MNTNEPVVEIRPEKKIQARTGFEPMTSAHGPECKLTSSGCEDRSYSFLHRNAHIRFLYIYSQIRDSYFSFQNPHRPLAGPPLTLT